MNLDQVLTQYGVKMKQLVVLDFSFPEEGLREFESAYPNRYAHMPSHEDVALQVAAGMATLGKHVLVIGTELTECDLPDSTLNVKLVKPDEQGTWEDFEKGLRGFGTGVLLIPEDE